MAPVTFGPVQSSTLEPMTNPFAYRESHNPLSRLAAGPKALFLLCLATAAMTFGPVPLGFLLAGGIILWRVTRTAVGDSKEVPLFILGISAAAALLKGLIPGDGRIFAVETLGPSAMYAARLAAAYFYAQTFYLSTRIAQLGDLLTGLFRKLVSKAAMEDSSPLKDPGLIVTLTLLFLPRVFDDFIRVREAAALRGYGAGKKSIGRGLAILTTTILVAVKGGLKTAKALEARAYSSSRTLETRKLTRMDWITAVAGPLILTLGTILGAKR